MVKVNTKAELKDAIIAHEPEIVAGNKRMAATMLASSAAYGMAEKLKRLPTKEELVAVLMKPDCVASEIGVLTEGTLIALAVIAAVTAISIVALCVKQTVEIKYKPLPIPGSLSLSTKPSK